MLRFHTYVLYEIAQQDVFSKKFAWRIRTMIASRLIWYKHYYRWADEIIMAMDNPPDWVLEISTVKYFPKAVEIIGEFVYSEPFEEFDDDQYVDEYVSCLFIQRERGAISWATFLNKTGRLTDAHNGRRECGYFYHMLNMLEDEEYSKDVEQSQKAEIKREFSTALSYIRPLYNDFLGYFRAYVSNEQQNKTG